MAARLMMWRAAIVAASVAVCAPQGWAQGAPALSGKVTPEREGPMEGVLISAKRPGSTITVTVVSDDKGQYAFPAGRLEPGRHQLSIRATGYALDGAGAADV